MDASRPHEHDGVPVLPAADVAGSPRRDRRRARRRRERRARQRLALVDAQRAVGRAPRRRAHDLRQPQAVLDVGRDRRQLRRRVLHGLSRRRRHAGRDARPHLHQRDAARDARERPPVQRGDAQRRGARARRRAGRADHRRPRVHRADEGRDAVDHRRGGERLDRPLRDELAVAGARARADPRRRERSDRAA